MKGVWVAERGRLDCGTRGRDGLNGGRRERERVAVQTR